MEKIFYPKGVCSRMITFTLQERENTVANVKIIGGCSGNGKAISALVEGMKAEKAIKILSGITCGDKSTSCPAQLAQAIQEALDDIKKEHENA